MVEVGIEFLTPFGSNLGPKMDPNWAQNGSRIRFKNDQIFDTFWGGSWTPFFHFSLLFLGPNWAHARWQKPFWRIQTAIFFLAQDEIFRGLPPGSATRKVR